MIQTERLNIKPLSYGELLRYAFGRKGSVVEDKDEIWILEDLAINVRNKKDELFYTFWVADDNGEWVGDIGVKGTPSEFGMVEIWYHVAEGKRSNGYGTEMTKAFVRWLSLDKRVNFVCAMVDFNNEASKRALIKNGFKIINKTENQYIFILQI